MPGWGLVANGANHVIRGLELSVPHPPNPRRGEGLEVESVAKGNDVINCGYIMKLP